MLPTVLRRWSGCYSYFVWLCGFYYGAFHVEACLALCFRVVYFTGPFSIVITLLREDRAGLYASSAFVCLFCTRCFLSVFSSSWCRELTAACDCGTPWIFLLTLCFHCFSFSLIIFPLFWGNSIYFPI